MVRMPYHSHSRVICGVAGGVAGGDGDTAGEVMLACWYVGMEGDEEELAVDRSEERG